MKTRTIGNVKSDIGNSKFEIILVVSVHVPITSEGSVSKRSRWIVITVSLFLLLVKFVHLMIFYHIEQYHIEIGLEVEVEVGFEFNFLFLFLFLFFLFLYQS